MPYSVAYNSPLQTTTVERETAAATLEAVLELQASAHTIVSIISPSGHALSLADLEGVVEADLRAFGADPSAE